MFYFFRNKVCLFSECVFSENIVALKEDDNMEAKTKFYKAVCMCGHVGRNKYIPIAFAITAKSGKDAAKIARDMPRVKHHMKYAVLSCTEIDEEQYKELKRINSEDPYLSCKNIQEQRKHPEIIQRAVRMVTKKREKQKNESSKKYRNWKRKERYDIVNIIEEENEYFYETEEDAILEETL